MTWIYEMNNKRNLYRGSSASPWSCGSKKLWSPHTTYKNSHSIQQMPACRFPSLSRVIKPTSLEHITIRKISMANNRILFLIRSMSVMGWAFGCAIYPLLLERGCIWWVLWVPKRFHNLSWLYGGCCYGKLHSGTPVWLTVVVVVLKRKMSGLMNRCYYLWNIMYVLRQTGQFIVHSQDILFFLFHHSASQLSRVSNGYCQPEVSLLFDVKKAKTPKTKSPSEIS